MSARVHVLLLAEADPEPAHLRGWLEARLRRPGGAGGGACKESKDACHVLPPITTAATPR